jgi:hypothetical protein
MSYAKEDLEDLYKIFATIGALKDKIKEQDPIGARGFVDLLDEVLKLRADVEKLKIKNRE